MYKVKEVSEIAKMKMKVFQNSSFLNTLKNTFLNKISVIK